MPEREYQDIYNRTLVLLETHPYIMLAKLGEHVKNIIPGNVGLRQVLSLSDNFELLVDPDPAKRERVAVCKKSDNEARELFYTKYRIKPVDSVDLLRSILCAFTQTVPPEHKVFIENRYPYKFKNTPTTPTGDDWIELSPALICQNNGDFFSLAADKQTELLAKIQQWALDNEIDYKLLSATKGARISSASSEKGSELLLRFLSSQPQSIRDKIVLPADFVSFLLSKK